MPEEKLRTRAQIPAEDKWNVEKIYKNTAEWEKDFAMLKEKVARVPEFRGKLNQPESLYGFFELDEEISALANKLAIFAHLPRSQTRNSWR